MKTTTTKATVLRNILTNLPTDENPIGANTVMLPDGATFVGAQLHPNGVEVFHKSKHTAEDEQTKVADLGEIETFPREVAIVRTGTLVEGEHIATLSLGIRQPAVHVFAI